MNYVKACPKCGSTMVKMVFDRDKKRCVSKCLNCSFKGDELFEDVDVSLIEARIKVKQNAGKDNGTA